MSSTINGAVFMDGGSTRYGGTETIVHGLNQWLEGGRGRLVFTLGDGQRVSLKPQRAFKGRDGSLTLRVGFDPPRRAARRAPARRAA